MQRLYFLVFVLFFALPTDSLAEKKWHELKTPTKNAPDIYGSYSAGCVDGAQELPLTGEGYHHMRRARGKFFGHPSLIKFIENFSLKIKEHGMGRLLIADLSAPRGGHPSPDSKHKSHQNGLDVDIWFKRLTTEDKKPFHFKRSNELPCPRMTTKNNQAIERKNWDESNIKVLEIAAGFQNVERILVNPAIKKEICKYHKGEVWLSKIRPWWGHNYHYHVRLKCPAGSPACKAQWEPDPNKDGCDESLDWWFSEEAMELARQPSKPYVPPPLPKACGAVLAAEDQ